MARLILADSSAWIEFLRDTGSVVCDELERLLRTSNVAITDAVVMEVLAGARDDGHLRQLRGLLGHAELLPCVTGDYDHGALLYRQCRRQGETVRRLVHCLIASVAIRNHVPVLHADVDFDVLARHSALALHRA